MKNNNVFKSSRLALAFTISLLVGASCEEDSTQSFTPYRAVIGGPSTVAPGEVATYYTDTYGSETVSWTVPTGATIVSGAGTESIEVTFAAGASGEIAVVKQGLNGTIAVTVEAVKPVASVSLDSGVVLRQGQSAPVTISFDKDIEIAPAATLLSLGTGITGSALSPLVKTDDKTFQATYTAGTGDGTEVLSLEEAVASQFLGATVMDSSGFELYAVDNTAATGKLFASSTPVDDSTAVTLSAIFSEPLSTTDTVKVSVNGASQAYVTEANMTTEDGMTWTYEFQPEGGANEVATVSVGNLPSDPAGNSTQAVSPIVIQIKND